MSHNIVAVLSLAVSVAFLQPPETNAQAGPPEPHEWQPLEAQLLPATGSHFVAFRLSRPSHVAVFAIIGGQAELVFPWRSAQLSLLQAGTHSSFTSGVRLRASSSPSSRGIRVADESVPVAYLLIASERPLAVAPLVADPLRLRRELAAFGPAHRDEHEVMNLLTGLTLPTSIRDEEWTTDVLYDWSAAGPRHAPQPAYSSFRTVKTVWLIPVKFRLGHHPRACPPGAHGRSALKSRCPRPAGGATIRLPRRSASGDSGATVGQRTPKVVRPPRAAKAGSGVVRVEGAERGGPWRLRMESRARQQSSPRPSASPAAPAERPTVSVPATRRPAPRIRQAPAPRTQSIRTPNQTS